MNRLFPLLFLGTFAFCMAALPEARSVPHPFAPVATVTCAMLLAVTCVAWLIFFINHISQSISVNHIVDRIARETEGVIDEIMPDTLRHAYDQEGVPYDDKKSERLIATAVSGYIRYIDTGRLLSLAKAFKVRVRILRRVGHFVPAGIALFGCSPDDRLDSERECELRAAFDIGRSRTLQQDVEFGVIQIVDIALKAISTAVNDPSTAITCVDQLGRILIRFVDRHPPLTLLCDPPHRRAYGRVARGSRPAHLCGCAERLGPEEVALLRQRIGPLEGRMTRADARRGTSNLPVGA
jgi:uncharacterized membrane protein